VGMRTRESSSGLPATLQFFGARAGAPAQAPDGPAARRLLSQRAALEIIDSLRSPYTPARGPIIDKIIREWAVHGLRSDHEAAIDRFCDDGLSIVGLARSASQGIVVVRAVASYLTLPDS
jgi:hypothetical protein